jgi:hypothetical protein
MHHIAQVEQAEIKYGVPRIPIELCTTRLDTKGIEELHKCEGFTYYQKRISRRNGGLFFRSRR